MAAQMARSGPVTWVAPIAVYDVARSGTQEAPAGAASGCGPMPCRLWEAISGSGDREALAMLSNDTEPGGTVALMASFGVRSQPQTRDLVRSTPETTEQIGLREYFELRFVGFDDAGITLEERRTDVDLSLMECFARNVGNNAHLVIGWHLGLIGCDDALEAAPWKAQRVLLDSRPVVQLSRGTGRLPIALPLRVTVVDGRLRASIEQ
mgnify:CR=1 FL=1